MYELRHVMRRNIRGCWVVRSLQPAVHAYLPPRSIGFRSQDSPGTES
jgi:hypothetical protein